MFRDALTLLLTLDPDLMETIWLSLKVSLSAVVLSCLFGLPLGAFAGAVKFPGRGVLVILLNTFMGLPPVVVGLVVYITL